MIIKFENVQAKRLYDSICKLEGEEKAAKILPSQWCDCTLWYAEEMFNKITGDNTKER